MNVFSGQDFDARLDDTERAAHVFAQPPQNPSRGQYAVVDVLIQNVREFAADQEGLMRFGKVVRNQALHLVDAEFLESAHDAVRAHANAVYPREAGRIDLALQILPEARVNTCVVVRQFLLQTLYSLVSQEVFV